MEQIGLFFVFVKNLNWLSQKKCIPESQSEQDYIFIKEREQIWITVPYKRVHTL